MSMFLTSALTQKSVADVTRRKGRTLVVILSIFFGVLGLTGINVFAFKTSDAFALQQDSSHYPDITLQVDHANAALTTEIAALPDVQTAQTQMTGKAQWQTADGPVTMNITAFPDPAHTILGGYTLNTGSNPGPGQIAMEMTDLSLHSFSLGQTVQLVNSNKTISATIVGTVQTSGLSSVKGTKVAQGYMSPDSLGQLLATTQTNTIAIKVRNIETIQDTVQAIHNLLQQQNVKIQNEVVQSSISVQAGLDFITGFFNLVRVLASGAILVSCFLIINSLTTLISEQMKIIGTMKAMGGTQSAIIKSYLLTVLIYSIVGTLLGLALGIAIGYAGAWLLTKQKFIYLGPFSIPLSIFLIGIGTGLLVPMLTALLTLLNGTRITVREALNTYGVTSVSNTRRTRWQRLTSERLVWVPQTVWLGFRGLFRKRSRAIMTIIPLSLAGIAFLAVTSFTYSIDQMIPQLRQSYSYDITVSPATSRPFQRTCPQLCNLVARLPNVALAEPGISTGISTQGTTIDLEGIDSNTQIYQKPITNGRWFVPGEHNVLLLDEQTLHSVHLSIGDMLPFTDGNGHAKSWKIIGTINDRPTVVGFGGVAITSIENVNGLLGNPKDSIGTLYIQARDHSSTAQSQLVNQINQALEGKENASPAITKQYQLSTDEYSALSLEIVFYVAAIGVAIVGILGLSNTLMSSVLERQREIGVWRSMGATNWQVSRIFWIEGMSLTLLTWLVSMIIGVPIAYGFNLLVSQWLFPVPFVFNFLSLPLMLLALVLIALLACFGPTARASHTRIAIILRYE